MCEMRKVVEITSACAKDERRSRLGPYSLKKINAKVHTFVWQRKIGHCKNGPFWERSEKCDYFLP